MKRSLSYVLALVIAFAGLASAQARTPTTTKPSPSLSANAAARRNPPSTLSSNPIMRVVRRVAAAIGVGDAEPEKAPVRASNKTAKAQTVQATTRPVSNPRATPNAGASVPAAPVKAPAGDPRKGALPLPTAPATDTSPRVLINREVFQYDGDGRRDPFVSLFTTAD